MEFDNLHQILRSLYEQMMPLCGDMAGVAKGIAGLGALGCRYEDEHPGVFIGSDYVQYPPQKQEMKMK